MVTGHICGFSLVWDLGLGDRLFLGHGLCVCVFCLGSNMDPMDCLCRRRCSIARLVDADFLPQTKFCCHILLDGWCGWKSHSCLGCLSRHCHQTAYVARGVAIGSDYHCIFCVYILLVHHSAFAKIMDWMRLKMVNR